MDCKSTNAFHRNCFDGFAKHADCGQDGSHAAAAPEGSGVALSPAQIVDLLRSHARLWIVPTVVCTVLAAGYALVASRSWRANQAFIVRPEAASVSDEKLGKFSDLSEMKTLQETVLELAKSYGVIEATLKKIGPRNGRASAGWPTAKDVEDFRQQVDMRPPGGAEFGKTEVFYLSVLDSNRVRAARTVAVLCDELEQRLQGVRDERAQSMIAELRKAVAMAESDLADRTGQLGAFETKIGTDLIELRNLNSPGGSPGEVSQELQAIGTERRANEASRRENARLLALLEAAQNDPKQILATPSSLLHSQPAVERLKNALVDAQVRTAMLLGSRSEKHPQVLAAREAEAAVRNQLHDEIGTATQGLNVELALNADREQALLAKWMEARERISHLAEARAEYSNLVTATENHTRLVEVARKNLAEARARQAASHSASLINRIDGVEAGVSPVGPGRTTITAAGGVAGLVLGLGLVFLFGSAPSNANQSVANRVNVAAADAPRQASRRDHATRSENPVGGYGLVGVPITSTHSQTSAAAPIRGQEPFGLFSGMTLEEAIRSVEGNRAARARS